MSIKDFIFLCVDKTALTMLYQEQFNPILALDDFGDDYSAMCRVEADFSLKVMAHMQVLSNDIEKEDGWDKYLVEVIRPAMVELAQIKSRFEENLCLLSPEKPDPTAFYEFKTRTLKAMEPYMQP